MSYYYLVASLPTLDRGDPPPMTPEEFLFHCTGALSSADWLELERVVQGRGEDCVSPWGRKWSSADTQMRSGGAKIRAGRLGRDAAEFIRPHEEYDVGVDRAVSEAFAKTTPLELERTLDQRRWEVLDELSLEDPFGLAPVLAFAVKLRITARWHDMQEEAGRQRVEEIIEANTGRAAWDEFLAMDEEDGRAIK